MHNIATKRALRILRERGVTGVDLSPYSESLYLQVQGGARLRFARHQHPVHGYGLDGHWSFAIEGGEDTVWDGFKDPFCLDGLRICALAMLMFNMGGFYDLFMWEIGCPFHDEAEDLPFCPEDTGLHKQWRSRVAQEEATHFFRKQRAARDAELLALRRKRGITKAKARFNTVHGIVY